MPTYYNSFTPYILSSPLPDRSSNLLPTPDSETWESARKPFFDPGIFAPASDDSDNWTGIILDGWVGVALSGAESATTNFIPLMATFTNTGDVPVYVYWLPLDAGLGTFLSTNTQSELLLPGKTTTVYGRWTEDLYDNSDFPGSFGVNAYAGSAGSTVDVTVVQLDIDETLTAMGLTAA